MANKKVQKPNDWPKNARESALTLIKQFCDDFIKDPTYTNKERLIALTTFDDPNKNFNLGLLRFTDYESALINELYLSFKALNFQYGINYLYGLLWTSAHCIKMCNMFPYSTIKIEECYQGLIPWLWFFFVASYYYFVEKQRSLCDELLLEIDSFEKSGKVTPKQLATIFNNTLYDLSGKCTNHWFNEFNFSRNDLYKLFSKSSLLMKKASFKQTIRPHKGILSMTIANFVLRSRNNYQFENIYKCVDKTTVDASFYNSELWMRRKTRLNDKREGKVIKEVFSKKRWIKYNWAKSMKFTFERESFTCSFSKELPTADLKKRYGKYIYGYHNDVVGPSIATLIKAGEKSAFFSQYIMYDVLYSQDEFREEMNYLFSIIDTFDLSDKEKTFFLEEIIDYWKLTIKDKKWENEKERRYEIMHFNEYQYSECKLDDEFLKNKTPLLLFPDFIIGRNHMKDFLLLNAKAKGLFQATDDYPVICPNCLFHTYQFDKERGCEICGTKNFLVLSKSNNSNNN